MVCGRSRNQSPTNCKPLCRLRCDLCDRYEWWLRRGTERLLWLRLYQNDVIALSIQERWQYYLRMSCLFFYAYLHVQYIYLTHRLYTMYHTFHVKQARIQRGRGGAEFRTLASLAIILQTVYILPNAMLSMERSSSFLYFPYSNYEMDPTYYPVLFDRAFHILLSKRIFNDKAFFFFTA